MDKGLSKRIKEKKEKFIAIENPPFPKVVMLEMSNACQYNCKFCARPRLMPKSKFLDFEVGKDFLGESYDNGARELALNGCGEQFLHKDIAKFTEYAKKIGFKYIYATSNGGAPINRYFDTINAGLDSLKISFNAATSFEYAIIQGVSEKAFTNVQNKINNLARYIKKHNIKTNLYISSVYYESMPPNLMNNLKSLFPSGIKEIVLYQALNHGGQNSSLPNAKFPNNLCYMPYNFMRLTSAGMINACCIDFTDKLAVGKYKIGNLNKIWNSTTYRELRHKMINKNLDGIQCSLCIYGYSKIAVKPLHLCDI